jgi:hypothetical protein
MSKKNQNDFKLNLQELFEEYAWKRFNNTRSVVSRIFKRRSKFYIDVRWGYVDFKHETTRFEERPDAVDVTPAEISVSGETNVKGSPKASKDVILYQSDYENRTPMDQEYNFSSTRETTNSTTVELQESYTKGGECNIEISVPGDLVTVGAGLSGELCVTETETETFETTTSWTVDTKINVQKGHKAEAKVHVSERNSVADFEVKTTMKVIDGKELLIAIRRVSDDKLVHIVGVPDLLDVFYELVENNSNVESVEYLDKTRSTPRKRHKVILYSRGTCKSMSWKNQHVEVHSERIPSYVIEGEESTKDDKP